MLIGELICFIKETIADVAKTLTSKRGIKRLLRVSIYRNAVYLMLNSGVSAIVGILFWIVVTRLYSTSDVGLCSALLSVAGLLSFVGTLGLGFGIIRFLPRSGEKMRLLNSSFTFATLTAMVVALIFLAGLPFWSPKLVFVREDPIFFTTFVIFVATVAVSQILIQAFIAFRRAGFTFAYTIIVSLLKLALVAGLASLFNVFWIFASWVVATAVSLVVSFVIFLPQILPHYRPIPSLQTRGNSELIHFSFVNYISQALWNLPGWILPLMALNILSAEATAYFYIGWTMSGLLLAISSSTSLSLFAEGSYKDERLGTDLRRSLKLITLLLLSAIVIMVLLGDQLLLLFGREYSAEGTHLLWLLALAALPASVNLLYLGVVRVEKKLKNILLITGAIAFVTLILSYLLLPWLGIVGAGVGWLAAQTAVALVVAPKLAKRLK